MFFEDFIDVLKKEFVVNMHIYISIIIIYFVFVTIILHFFIKIIEKIAKKQFKKNRIIFKIVGYIISLYLFENYFLSTTRFLVNRRMLFIDN